MNHIVLPLAAERLRQRDRKIAAETNGNNVSAEHLFGGCFFFFGGRYLHNLLLFSSRSVPSNRLVCVKWIAKILFTFHYLEVWSCEIFSPQTKLILTQKRLSCSRVIQVFTLLNFDS